MKKCLILISIIIFVVSTNIFAADGTILPGQMDAIKILSQRAGFSDKALNQYIVENYDKFLNQLSKEQGAVLITLFQSENPPKTEDLKQEPLQTNVFEKLKIIKPKPIPVQKEIQKNHKPLDKPQIAEVLEVGMEKRFHLIDNNIIYGKITKIENEICHIKTNDSNLKIPKNDILSEIAIVTKKDQTRFTGAVLSETAEQIIIRSRYGDIPIHKRDIRDLDKYHGGQKTKREENIREFYRGEAQLINIMEDATAFVLEPQTFYISGMSVGYGFTDKFMLTTKFGSSFSGDLNIHPKINLLHYQNGASEHGLTLGIGIHRRYAEKRLIAKYSQAIIEDATDETLNNKNLDLNSVMLNPDLKSIYSEFYLVYSNRKSLKSGRGKVGYSMGIKTNSLAWNEPGLVDGYSWSDKGEFAMPFRFWVAFEYDLRKNLKFVSSFWVDNGNKTQTLSQVTHDYFTDNTPFIFDCHEGDYSIIDFDFGFLYAVNDNLRVGLHFQDPFFEFYWEFFEF